MRLRALWSVANDLRPFYDEKAKDRQHVGRPKELLEKIPELKEGPTARDESVRTPQPDRRSGEYLAGEEV